MATTSTLAFREWTYTEQWQEQKQEQQQSDGSSSHQKNHGSGSIQALLWHSLSVNSSSSCLLLLFACTREGDLVVWNVSTTNDDCQHPSTTLLRQQQQQQQQHLPLWKRQIVANRGALYAMAWLDDKDKTAQTQAQARRRLLVAGVGGIYVLDAARIVQECTTTTTTSATTIITRPSSSSSGSSIGAVSGDKDSASSCASIILAHCPTHPTPVPTSVTQMAVVVVVGDDDATTTTTTSTAATTTTTTSKAAAVYGVVPNDAFGAYQWNLDNNDDSTKKVVRTWPTTTTSSSSTSRGARIAQQQHVTVTAVDALVTTTQAILEEDDRNVNNFSSPANTDKDNNVLVAIGDSAGVVQLWKGSQVQTILQLSPLEQQQQQQRPVQACRFWNTTDWLVVVYGDGGGLSTSSGSGSASAMHRPQGQQQQQKQRAGSLIVMWHVPTQHVVAQVSTAPTTVHCLHVTANNVLVGNNQGQVTVYTPCDLQHVCTVVSSSSSSSPCIHGIAVTTTTLSLSSTDDSPQQKQWIAMAGVGNTIQVLDQDYLPWQTLQL